MSRATILIATRNRAEQLRYGLQSIHAKDYRDVDILVVDDGSTDNTAAILAESQLPLKVIELQRQSGYRHNPGFVFNEGHRQAKTNVVIEQGGEVCHLTDCVTPLLELCRPGIVAIARCYNGSPEQMRCLQAIIDHGEYEFSADYTPDNVPYVGANLPILPDKFGAQTISHGREILFQRNSRGVSLTALENMMGYQWHE